MCCFLISRVVDKMIQLREVIGTQEPHVKSCSYMYFIPGKKSNCDSGQPAKALQFQSQAAHKRPTWNCKAFAGWVVMFSFLILHSKHSCPLFFTCCYFFLFNGGKCRTFMWKAPPVHGKSLFSWKGVMHFQSTFPVQILTFIGVLYLILKARFSRF